jgi:hypothetical protein
MEEQGIEIPSDLEAIAQLLKLEAGNTLVAGKDDILIVTISGIMGADQFEHMALNVKATVAETTGRKVLVLPESVSISVLNML